MNLALPTIVTLLAAVFFFVLERAVCRRLAVQAVAARHAAS
jgi:hypothetical protein